MVIKRLDLRLNDELDSKLKTEEKKTNIYKFVITREMKANYLN